MSSISYSKLVGKRTLIMGEVSTGKTSLTRKLLNEAIARDQGEISIIDMAPGEIIVNGAVVGGALLKEDEKGLRILRSHNIKPPRLTAKSPEELLNLADGNKMETERLLRSFIENPTKVLFINDVSIYLQRGDLETLLEATNKAETVVANGYYGERLREDLGTGISAREKAMMDALDEKMDITILTNRFNLPPIVLNLKSR